MFSDVKETQDQYGFHIINVTGKHLTDFPSFVNWFLQKGYGKDTGLVKLRLSTADRKDLKCVQQITKLMEKKFVEKTWDKDDKLFKYVYHPSVQIALRASEDHIYQYSKAECTLDERQVFVESAVKPSSYLNNDNCCTQVLAQGSLDHLRHHIYDELGKSSLNLLDESVSSSPITGPVYGDGIMLHKNARIKISEGFSLSSGLDNLLHLLDQKDDGISYPYIYSGDHKTFFPWHIEDGGLYSINYVFTGAPKFWFGVSPRYFGLMEKIGSGLRLDTAHTSCRAFLSDHKVLVADPQYFKDHFEVPYVQVIQEPGDFIVTLPFGLHSGWNLGKNLSIAANFANDAWIELGMYAPICSCNPTQVQLDMTNILKMHRPHLLKLYVSEGALVFPRSHPREVCYPSDSTSSPHRPTKPEESPQKVQNLSPRKRVKVASKGRITDRVLQCTRCKQTFAGNKMNRLELHITANHSEEEETLLQEVREKYPAWKPKMTKGLTCKICHKFYRGDKRNLKSHVAAMHRS